MHRFARDTILVILIVIYCLVSMPGSTVLAQDSAPSSHFVFDDTFSGDIIINEVRIPANGEVMYTYYEALGWSGKGAGYAGLQAHPRAHNFIFSIWDHKEHTAPIRVVHRGPGTETEGFGGEGTGLKSWNFKLGWSTDTWYTLVARAWPDKDHTFFGFWVRAGDPGDWTHLVTMDVAVANASFRGGTDAFIEDWLSTGKDQRTTHLRAGWKRKLDGTWFPFGSGKYSVNRWDLDKGKRSYRFRTNWNGGVRFDKSGSYYFMESGGNKTKPETGNPSRHRIPRKADRPAFDVIAIDKVEITGLGDGKLKIDWSLAPSSSPQFSYELLIQKPDADGTVGWSPVVAKTVPHLRSMVIDLDSPEFSSPQTSLQLRCVDVFGNKSLGKEFKTSPE